MRKVFTSLLLVLCFATRMFSQNVLAEESIKEYQDKEINGFPVPTAQQMRAFQEGDIEELSNFIGAANTVVLASKYKSQWEIINYKNSGKCVLRSYFRIVLSKDPAWKTGDLIVIQNYIEDFNSIPKLTIKKWENPTGELLYLFNLRKLQTSDSGVLPKCEAARTCSVLENDKRNYQTLWATLKAKK